MNCPNVNAHLHTPYSFSAFERLTDALDRAVKENVKVVGINDFYSMDGYVEWRDEALKRNLFPLFNIEFISLQEEDRARGIRVNDPNNPGRTYLSGKGLKCPPDLPEPQAAMLAGVRGESNRQTRMMCDRLNETLATHDAGFRLDFDLIEKELTKGAVRERHLAKALRMATYRQLHDDAAAIALFFEKLFGGKALKSDAANHAAVENEIRSNLLKAGGAAFVPEDPKAFLPLDAVCRIILAAGGIPTYPFLADDANGCFTDFEQDVAKAADTLERRGIFAAEFITTRNSVETLEQYAGYLHDRGFAVTFGSEHNTPAMEPVELFARGGTPLTARLKQINYEGACVIAAHQQRVRDGKPGYPETGGMPCIERRDRFVCEGNEAIASVAS
ncbi:MAG: PHP domain-containing protein [Tannerella sp.]|jgi:predicted metal-dependent phosphoesterase TrpH|nr:PHP domain-containing protein [Tannerella sp.]